MRVWIKRILAFAMVLSLFAGTFSASIHAVSRPNDEALAKQIKQQIKTVYRKALSRNGTKTLEGYCGRATDYQLYFLGINTTLEFKNGNAQFDYYVNKKTTSGGYKINTYSAASYTLEEALLAASYNGTKTIYNLMVGFQRTNTPDGKKYGHACLIHAIIGGKVYFTESYDTMAAGKMYKEGAPIVVSIKAFAEKYQNAQFEGIVHFTQKTYADECKNYRTHMYVQVTQDTMIQTDPHVTAEGISDILREVNAGDRLEVIGLFKNSLGEYWYRVQEQYSYGYIKAEAVKLLDFCYDDVTLVGMYAPTRIYRGKTFTVRGQVGTKYNQIDSVTVKIYARTSGKTYLKKTASVNGTLYNLNNTAMNNAIDFRDLVNGDYIYKVIANVENYYVENGELATHENSVTLWTSNFLVNRSSSTYRSIKFNAGYGEASVRQIAVINGGKLALLPTATRPGYRFEGWYTSTGSKITLNTVFKKSMTVYARWTAEAPSVDGWHQINDEWFYYRDGQKVTGWFTQENATFYLTEEGMLQGGWHEVEGKEYYFGMSGELQQGWLDLDGYRYYLNEEGTPLTGWNTIDGKCYFFAEDGLMRTGWVEENGQLHYLDENGVKVTSVPVLDDVVRPFGNDGSLLISIGH